MKNGSNLKVWPWNLKNLKTKFDVVKKKNLFYFISGAPTFLKI